MGLAKVVSRSMDQSRIGAVESESDWYWLIWTMQWIPRLSTVIPSLMPR